MKKYRVYMQTTASTVIEVEADDEDAAVEAAYEAGTPSLCAYCAGSGQSHNMEVGDDWDVSEQRDADGKVTFSGVEEVDE